MTKDRLTSIQIDKRGAQVIYLCASFLSKCGFQTLNEMYIEINDCIWYNVSHL